MTDRSQALALALLWSVCGGVGATAGAQENPVAPIGEAPAAAATQEKFDQQSLALRTALFYDPSLEPPLQSLLELYRKANREEELLGLYRNHVGQYPDDAGAHAVLIRLLQELKRPEASAVAQTAAQAHPDNGFLLYLRSVELETQRDPRALDVLAEAIGRETDPARRRAWADRLVTRGVAEGRRELAEKQLRSLAGLPNQSAEALVALAARMNRERFFAAAAETLAMAGKATPTAELGVEIALQQAAAEAGEGRKSEAGARLDALLQKMAPDYPRRAEVVQRRVALLGSDAERGDHLRRARAAWEGAPTSESAAVDLAELLIASELKIDALKVLRQASEALPKSERLEKMTLSLLDRLSDERSMREFLENRLAQQPDRTDLAYRLVKSLHLLGSHEEADKRFAALLEKTPPADRVTAELELARSLRRQNLPGAAVPHFRAVLAAQPARVDLRRELAETLMAAGDAGAARELLKGAIADDAEIENFLDLVSFLIQQNFLPEAAAALRTRMAREPRQFEFPLQLIDVLARQGEPREGGALVESSRVLADTEARYRRWLEVAAAFHETFDTLAAFASSENVRLLSDADAKQGGWTPERIRRYLSFCDATRHGAAEPALIESIAEQLKKTDLPADLRTSLHRLYVEAIGRDPKNRIEVQNHLAQLAVEDPAHADEYRLKLARGRAETTAATGGDYTAIRALLAEVDPAKIGDPAVLRGAQKLFFDLDEVPKGLALLERLTVLEPADRSHWERWTAALAGMGDEERLRVSLRQLLAGVTKPALRDDSLDRLRDYLVDSCWRSIAAIVALDDAERVQETLALLDEIERTKKLDRSLLWVLWTRAWILRETGQSRAAEEAIHRLELAAKPDPAPPTDAAAPATAETAPPRLFFPDGLSLSLNAGLEMLREPKSAGPAAAETAAGPPTPPKMRWAFRTDRGSAVTQTLPGGGTLLVFDETGTAYGVDIPTGKLRWRRTGLWKGPGPSGPTDLPFRQSRRVGMGTYGPGAYVDRTMASLPPRAVVSADGRRFFTGRGGILTARDVQTGENLWEMTLGGDSVRPKPAAGQVSPPPLPDEVFLDGEGRVIVWRGETATAAAVHPTTGKLLWARTLAPGPVGSQVTAFNAGASCDAERLFVYGFSHAVLSTATGEPIWSFEREKVREFPLELRSVEEQKASGMAVAPASATSATSPSQLNVSGGTPPARLAMNHLKPLAERPPTLSRWVDQKGALVAPAVAWAEQNGSAVAGTLYRGKMILSMSTMVQSLSLPLPVKTTRFDAVGGWLVGAGGGKAVVFGPGHSGALLDLARGGITNFQFGVAAKKSAAAPAAGMPDAVVAGPRLYVSGTAGVLCLNLATAQVLYFLPWSDEAARLLADPVDDASPPVDLATGQSVRAVSVYPRFFVRPGAGGPEVALQARGSASASTLFAVPTDDLVLALDADSAPETPPPSR